MAKGIYKRRFVGNHGKNRVNVNKRLIQRGVILNFKKLGIKVILATVILMWITKGLSIDPYLRTALLVFGYGSGFILMLLDSYRHFHN